MPEFQLLDTLALAWFFTAWIGFTVYADHSRWSRLGVGAAMDRHRRRWMKAMLGRELRMVDAQVQQSMQNGIAFFASTSIFVLGGLIAALVATESATTLFADLPFVVPMTPAVWEVKILLMIAIFVYAFFKFARAFRVSTYFVVLIGAAPSAPADDPAAADYAEATARIGGIVAEHMTHGLRAYFFALAGLGWLIHPAIFLVTTTWVLAVLWRREFRSRALAAIIRADQVLAARE